MTQSAKSKRFVQLLGPTRVEKIQGAQDKAEKTEAGGVPRFRSRRTAALLGYLAAERRPIARDFLVALFWPDEVLSKGRANLRRELHNLAQVLPDCWDVDHLAVAFAPSANTTVDIYSLLELEGHRRWEQAADLLGGEFLEGFDPEDNVELEKWLLAERRSWRGRAEGILTKVTKGHIRRGRYSDGLRFALRLLQLAPWNEEAHRQVMQLLAWTGQRGGALRHFEACKSTLQEELGVEPSEETINLYQKIYAGELDPPPQVPAFLAAERARHAVSPLPFVARERELARLDAFLGKALAGEGQVVFVTGGPGRGKTALMEAFAHRAMASHSDLLVASGNCNAYSSVGDPYLPFRDVMAMLTGDVEARWDAGAISGDHARRLWSALPLMIQALLDHGPHLVDVLVSGAGLLSRAALAERAFATSVQRLRDLMNRRKTRSHDVEQSYVFQQVTDVLRSLARERPLLLVLDDIQWADTASIGLLFHLGRRLADAASRVLIVCAYRPEEVALGRNGKRHPLIRTLSEFKRTFGDVWIELRPAESVEGREFVDAVIDSEPNRLGEDFRAALCQRTNGHPLFTVELLRAMQERGDLLKDEDEQWIEGPELDWDLLPARIEAVIAERIERLDPTLQEMLAVASVEGEMFTAQVIAETQKMPERSSLRLLSGELERQHRLVRGQEETRTSRGALSRYRFGHALFQEYVYKRLSPGERRILHRDVASALEMLYEGQVDEIAVQLGHHFKEAGEYGLALPYFTEAAERAARLYANDEAITHYARALALANRISALNPLSVARLRRGRGLAYVTLGDFDRARDDLETALKIAQGDGDRYLEWRLLVDLGKLWASRDYERTRDCFERALHLARDMNDATVLAGSLNWMGNWYANAENPVRAAELLEEALEIFDELEDQRGLANTLDLLGIANLLGGNLSASVAYYDRAIELFRELDNRPRLISSLMCRGTNVSLLVLLATAPALEPPDALDDIEGAIGVAQEIRSPPHEAMACWSLGLLYIVYGQFGRALEVVQRGIRLASELEHREWSVGNRFALGVLYVELLAPEKAVQQLEQAMTLCQELQSPYWINHVCGALAAAYISLGDLTVSEACLDRVLSAQTAMDTMGKRYCWARRAEVALLQDDPVRALDIADRLIDSAPGLSSGGVITFLWKLKGEALTEMGRVDKAISLLQAAAENARVQEERFLLWRLHALLGRAFRETGQATEARQEFLAAREVIDELAATIPDGTLKNNFLERAYNTADPAARRAQ